MSAKVRTGPPIEDEADLALRCGPASCRCARRPVPPSPDGVVPAGMELPAYLDQPARWKYRCSSSPMGTYIGPGVWRSTPSSGAGPG